MVKIYNKEVSGLPRISWARGKPTVVVAHDTANPNSTVTGERNYMAAHWRNAFYHYIVDENGMHMLHNPNKGGAWGAGPSMHNYAIHVELIHSHTRAGFNKAYKNYVDGIKYLAKKYSIPLKVNSGRDKRGIYTHNYVRATFGGTTHTDPDAYLRKWGVSISKLAKDIGASGGGATTGKGSSTTYKKVTGAWTGQILKIYQKGKPVRQLQKKLKKKGFLKKKDIDAYYGPSTKKAVKKAQKKAGISVDGIAGKSTYKALTGKKASVKKKKKKTSGGLPTGVIRRGARGAKVRKIQKALSKNKPPFYPNKGAKNNGIDGVYGGKTANAVKRFQKYYGLSADGVYGPKTRKKLGGKTVHKKKKKSSGGLPTGVVKRGARGAKVRKIQKSLSKNKPPFYPNKGAKNNGVDGVYGAKTANAVKRFQGYYGLTADGVYGPKTRAKLK